MRELQEVFIGKGQVKGFKFTQIKKNDYAYLYRVDTGDSKHYEIFEKRENIKFNCISYPSNKSFGKWAKTTKDYNRAVDIFFDISEVVECRINKRNY